MEEDLHNETGFVFVTSTPKKTFPCEEMRALLKLGLVEPVYY